MIEDIRMEQLLSEIMARLNMSDDHMDYEVSVPLPQYSLAIAGSSTACEFTLQAVAIDPDGSRFEAIPVKFVIMSQTGPMLKDNQTVDLPSWIRSDPWRGVNRPPREE